MAVVKLKERERVDTRGRIVAAAARLSDRDGMERVTLDAIATEAEIGKSTVDTHFDGKDDIAIALLIEADRKAFGEIALLPKEGMSVAEAIDAAAWTLLERKAPHGPCVRTFLCRLFGSDAMPADLTNHLRALDLAIEALFERLLARPGMRRALPAETLVLSFRSMYMGLLTQWLIEGAPYESTRVLTRRHGALLAKGLML
jgi:AcrR family transcriptional regulator